MTDAAFSDDPAARVTDPGFARLEWSRLWTRSWLLACHGSQVAAPGAREVFDLGASSVLVVRGADGAARAYRNVCPHRGRRLVEAEPCEPDARIRCPFHGWQWGLDGALAQVPDREVFPPLDGRADLQPVAAREACGFVWVCLGEPPPWEDFIADFADDVAAYAPASFARSEVGLSELACNWKLAVDAFNESHHVPFLHPEFAPALDLPNAQTTLGAQHSRMVIPLYPARGAPAPVSTRPAYQAALREAGFDPARFTGSTHDVAPALAHAWSLRLRALPERVGLGDERLASLCNWFVFPNVSIGLTPGRLLLHRFRPHASDPARSWMDEQTFVRPGAPELARPLRAGPSPVGPVSRQDVANLAAVQRGVASGDFRGDLLGARETRLAHMRSVLDRRLTAAPPERP